MSFQLDMPREVREIIGRLTENGYEAYAVGGCVRDALLHRVPKDWDITTSATPEEIKALFPKTIDTGIEHGTVTVLRNRQGFEVTTYRLDGEYEDCRHPKEVTFTKSLKEDLKRRDFTINAMAYNDDTGLVDLFNGLEDLENGIIRCVGDPTERFTEDALRVFRAVRFAAQLGFAIEPKTREGMRDLSGNLKRVSAERIREELTKLLLSEHPEELVTASECGMTAFWLPEWDQMLKTPQENVHHCFDVAGHTLAALKALHGFPEYKELTAKEQTTLSYAVLLHDCAKPACKSYGPDGVAHFYGHQKLSGEYTDRILHRLKFDNDTIAIATRLVYNHDTRFSVDRSNIETAVRKLANRIGTDNIPLLILIQRADTLAQAPAYHAESLSVLEKMQAAHSKILSEGQSVELKTLAVKGADLIAAGRTPGPELGRILSMLLDDVLEHPEHNNKAYLMELAERF